MNDRRNAAEFVYRSTLFGGKDMERCKECGAKAFCNAEGLCLKCAPPKTFEEGPPRKYTPPKNPPQPYEPSPEEIADHRRRLIAEHLAAKRREPLPAATQDMDETELEEIYE